MTGSWGKAQNETASSHSVVCWLGAVHQLLILDVSAQRPNVLAYVAKTRPLPHPVRAGSGGSSWVSHRGRGTTMWGGWPSLEQPLWYPLLHEVGGSLLPEHTPRLAFPRPGSFLDQNLCPPWVHWHFPPSHPCWNRGEGKRGAMSGHSPAACYRARKAASPHVQLSHHHLSCLSLWVATHPAFALGIFSPVIGWNSRVLLNLWVPTQHRPSVLTCTAASWSCGWNFCPQAEGLAWVRHLPEAVAGQCQGNTRNNTGRRETWLAFFHSLHRISAAASHTIDFLPGADLWQDFDIN